ncbi:hypothetical protein ACS0TY_002798 [Phlomoides rotata]
MFKKGRKSNLPKGCKIDSTWKNCSCIWKASKPIKDLLGNSIRLSSLIAAENLTPAQSNRVCNALALLQLDTEY